jgi:uncharacterized protein YyaL (SSP411 family)
MAHESFEDPAIGELLRKNFVAIKVDREERPDVDQLYMAAVQLLSGHGGWPMSMFLTPSGRPFTGGTYYPPTERGGQVSFTTLLNAIAGAWQDRRPEVEQQADAVESSLRREVSFVDHLAPSTNSLNLSRIRAQLSEELVQRTDAHGGSGQPRFPRPSFVRALLDQGESSTAATILRAMAFEGLYDHIAGGFARYSVDAQWHVPHFEQMLSDQALLARTYFLAANWFGNEEWRAVANATLDRLESTFAVPGGFASSLDADAAGVEGSHVTWTPNEVAAALRAAGCSSLLAETLHRWRITDHGEFEGRSIPRLAAGESFVTPTHLMPALEALQRERAHRPQPARDDKVILEWNAMAASAFLASRDEAHHDRARALLRSLTTTHHHNGSWRRMQDSDALATAADLAWLGDASIDAFELDGSDEWITLANGAADTLLAGFWDGPLPTVDEPSNGGGFFSTNVACRDIFLRPKDVFDGATPATHAVATRFFARLALVTADTNRALVAERLVDVARSLIESHPLAVVDLVEAAGFVLDGHTVVIPGDANALSDHVRLTPVSRTVLITGFGSSPLLRGRREGLAYVCRNGECSLPVSSRETLAAQLEGLR